MRTWQVWSEGIYSQRGHTISFTTITTAKAPMWVVHPLRGARTIISTNTNTDGVTTTTAISTNRICLRL
jgi:hypothetical protein